MPCEGITNDHPYVSKSVLLDRQKNKSQMQCYLLFQSSFHFLKHIVHFYRTCFYSCMLMMVLAFGELLLTVFTEILFHGPTLWHGSKCQHFGGIAANLQETLIGFCFCFYFCCPFQNSRDGRRKVQKLGITSSGSSSEVSHSISIF